MSHGKELMYLAQQLTEGIEAGDYKRLSMRTLCNLRGMAIQLEELGGLVCIMEKVRPTHSRPWWRIW